MKIFKVADKTTNLIERWISDIEKVRDLRTDIDKEQANRLMIAYTSLVRRIARTEDQYLEMTNDFANGFPDGTDKSDFDQTQKYFMYLTDEYGYPLYRKWRKPELVKYLDITREEQKKMASLFLSAEVQFRRYRQQKVEKES